MRRVHGYKMGLWSLALCLLLSAARGQDPAPTSGTTWFEVESSAISFGTLDPQVEVLPKPLVVRVHSDQEWALKLIPSPGLVVETGAPVPLDRLQWRPNTTGLFVPFDTSGPLTIASGMPTDAAGDLVLVELVLDLEETDAIGQYRFMLRLVLGPVDPMAATTTAAPSPAEANDATVTVVANNFGVFLCTVDVTSFDFGEVDLNGSDYGTPGVVAKGRNASNTGGTYENDSGAITWTCFTTPPSTVDIALNSTAADHTGGMVSDDLEMRIPPTAGGTSTGFQTFTSGAPLVAGMAVGSGANAARGELGLRLTVLDIDPAGNNTWIVRLRATGNP